MKNSLRRRGYFLLFCLYFVVLCLLFIGNEASTKKPTQETHYKLLGITQKASKKEIRDAYRKIAKTEHPDKLDDPTQQQKDRWILITEAYETLVNPLKRRDYDELLREKLRSSSGGWDSGYSSSWETDSFNDDDEYDDDHYDDDDDEFDDGPGGSFDNAQWKARQEADRPKQPNQPAPQRYEAYHAANVNKRSARQKGGWWEWLVNSFHFEVDEYDDEWEDGRSASSRWSEGQKDGRNLFEELNSGKTPPSKIHGQSKTPNSLDGKRSEEQIQTGGLWSWFKSKTNDAMSAMKMESILQGWDDDGGKQSNTQSSRQSPGNPSKKCPLVTQMTDEGIRTFRKCD
eukprot:TRINITY_DN6413_c0_g1_i1.p1 TRINITY_DN6413_c0_g1~~TRINITY_DN6413_c0_g1_i1.p1  ORF type:complete len:343 (+),score=88.95 TRINITY_DN6413_c0_g1_i1:154-1182(+)